MAVVNVESEDIHLLLFLCKKGLKETFFESKS